MIDCSLDTTAVIDSLRGERAVGTLLGRFSEIGFSHVVLGELFLGALKSQNPQRELQKILNLLENQTLLQADGMTAAIYAEIRSDLERQGAVIPQNDIWIAAVTIQCNVPLITRDQHFSRITKLKVLTY